MIRFAFIKDGLVDLILEAENYDSIANIARQYQNIIDITEEIPEPTVGCIFNGKTFLKADGDYLHKYISKEKFLSRFTDSEIYAIDEFAKGSSDYAKAVRAALKRQEQAEYIDLQYDKTISGVQNMVPLGLLTQERADLILYSPVTEDERYKG